MPASYRITEPHPSVPASAIYYGRGGAGNVTRVSQVTSGQDASGPASRIKLTPPPSNSRFLSGRGGAGNLVDEAPRKARTGSTSSRGSDESSEGVRRSVESAWHKMTRQFSHN